MQLTEDQIFALEDVLMKLRHDRMNDSIVDRLDHTAMFELNVASSTLFVYKGVSHHKKEFAIISSNGRVMYTQESE